MNDLFCPTHPQTKLAYALRGGAGYCEQCRLYVQAAGVPMPKPTKATGPGPRKTKHKKNAKVKTK